MCILLRTKETDKSVKLTCKMWSDVELQMPKIIQKIDLNTRASIVATEDKFLLSGQMMLGVLIHWFKESEDNCIFDFVKS